MKKAIIITLLMILSTLIQKVDAFSVENKTLSKIEVAEKIQIKENIEEKNKKRLENIEKTIENKLIFLELKEEFKILPETKKISFFKEILENVNSQIEIFEKSSYPIWEKKLEINLVLRKKLEERISKLYNTEIENAEILIELIEIN